MVYMGSEGQGRIEEHHTAHQLPITITDYNNPFNFNFNQPYKHTISTRSTKHLRSKCRAPPSSPLLPPWQLASPPRAPSPSSSPQTHIWVDKRFTGINNSPSIKV
ncbi:hypothetical protein PMIN06_008997 [Paraphaeosphaeria minitans]